MCTACVMLILLSFCIGLVDSDLFLSQSVFYVSLNLLQYLAYVKVTLLIEYRVHSVKSYLLANTDGATLVFSPKAYSLCDDTRQKDEVFSRSIQPILMMPPTRLLLLLQLGHQGSSTLILNHT